MKKTAHILQAPSPSSPSNLYPPPLTLPPPPPPSFLLHTNPILVIISFLAGAFVLSCYCTIIAKECRNRRRFTVPINNTHEDHDRSQNPTILYASRSGGLEESLINSITMCKYKSGDCLVEGTECSICLNEFCEYEDLRILPNCTHAFHLSCIDTWLKSNVNCPLCRKNVVSVSNSHRSRDPSSCSSDSEDETHVRNSPQGGVNRRCGNVDVSAIGESSSPQLRSGFWLQSDLDAVEVTNDDAELVRISDSVVDSSAPSMISKEDPSN